MKGSFDDAFSLYCDLNWQKVSTENIHAVIMRER